MRFPKLLVITFAAFAGSFSLGAMVAASDAQSGSPIDDALANVADAVEPDPIETRAEERETSRWWIVTADVNQLVAVDTHSLRSENSLRVGWQALLPLESSSVGANLMSFNIWDCSKKTVTEKKWAVYNPKGEHVPVQPERKSEPEQIIPESNGELVLEFVCGERRRGELVPVPVARPLREAALIFREYTGGREVTILGMWLATFDPEKDREALEKFLQIVTEPRRSRIRQLLWPVEARSN